MPKKNWLTLAAMVGLGVAGHQSGADPNRVTPASPAPPPPPIVEPSPSPYIPPPITVIPISGPRFSAGNLIGQAPPAGTILLNPYLYFITAIRDGKYFVTRTGGGFPSCDEWFSITQLDNMTNGDGSPTWRLLGGF